MTRRKSKYPPTFYEWVVGTTIENALGPIPKKKKPRRRRGVLRVEISTDDESGEDSVRITYPRTQPSENLPRKEVKKVRFQEQLPRKSALKKQTQVVAPPEPESEEAISDSATDGSSSELTDSAQSAESSGTNSEGSSEVDTTSEENETTDSDSGPQSSGKCKERRGSRRKLRKRQSNSRRHRGANSSSDSKSRRETESETNSPSEVKSRKYKKRASKKSEAMPESDTETSDSAPESSSEESEQEAKKKQKRTKKEKIKKRSYRKTAKSKKSSDESEQEEDRKSEKKKKAAREDASKTPKQTNRDRANKGNYPEANPVPHPRRPNYVAPVRAEVVQTERVIETPEDPPPNAYYDAEHNIIRVYQGPVYGGNPSRSLYPKRDSTQRPLPVGMPHPTQNPYYHGFNSQPSKAPETGNFNVPITQGMPVNAWHATYPHPDFAYQNFNPGLGAFNNRGAYHDSPELGAQKNALSKASEGHNVGPSSERNKARQGKNVTFAKGPQLTKHQRNKNRASVFADWGKRISPSGSQQGSKDGKASSGDKLGHTQWYHGNKEVSQTQNDGSQKASADGWNTEAQNDDNNAQDGNGTWDAPGNDGADGAAEQTNDGWGTAAPDNDDNWESNPAEGSWNGNDNDNNNATYENEDNNVAPEGSPMPGTYPTQPAWGDVSAAANTNGLADEAAWEEPQGDAEPVKGW